MEKKYKMDGITCAWTVNLPSQPEKLRFGKDKFAQYEPYQSPFRYVLLTLSFIGMTCKPSEKSIFHLSYWDTFMLTLVMSTTFFSISLIGSFNMSPQELSVYYIFLSLGFVLRIMFLFKRRNLYTIISWIRYLNVFLQVGAVKCQQCSRRSMVFFYSWLVFITVVLILYCIRLSTSNHSYYFFGVELVGRELGSFTSVLLQVSLAFATITSSCTISISLIVSSNLYYFARNILRAYGDKLRLRSKGDAVKNVLISNLSIYREIMVCFADLDSCVTFISLLLYATSVTCFFDAIGSCILTPKEIFYDTVMIGHVLISSFLGLMVFIILTYMGNSANSEYEKLKMRMLQLIESVTEKDLSCETAGLLNSLSQGIMMKSQKFTGGGMFIIDSSLILTTVGAMITYGVLIFN